MWIRRRLHVVAAAAAIAAGAAVALPVPGGWVPITLQTVAVLGAGALLGSRDGELAVVLYILCGVLGLPIFAGGASGLEVLLGPSGGYLLGFVAGAWFLGYLTPRTGPIRWWRSCADFLLGHAVILVAGYFWLSGSIGFARAWQAGVLPFLPGAIVKSAMAAGLLLLVRRRGLTAATEVGKDSAPPR